jgi:hypothetical protein
MQMENMKRNINLAIGGGHRRGPAAGRSRLASAVGGTVGNASGKADCNAVGSANSKAPSIASGRRGFAFRRTGLAAVAALMLFAARPSSAGAAVPLIYRQIQVALKSGNAAQTQWAVRQIDALSRGANSWQAMNELSSVWLEMMLRHHDYAAIAETTRAAILAAPARTGLVITLQTDRVRALLLMGHKKAALRNAKMLFNVVQSTQVAQTAILVYRCLLAQKSDGAELAREFCREQMAGAKPPKAGQPPKTCDVLAGITIHGKAYEDDVRRQVGVGTFTLVARGNLWLLADHPNKALKCFKAAYDIATPGELAMVCDRIAAAMRAKYGTIGAANAWLKSLAR